MRATAGTRPVAADPNAVTLLSPLDPLIHDRKRLEALYNFHYRWEIYTPEARRVYGPYVLPIHAGDALVGRIQLRRIKETGGTTIDGLWWERGARPARHIAGLATAIAAHQRLLGSTSGHMPKVIADRSDGRALIRALRKIAG
jgi:uncharacterized protein YcaQ